MDEAFRTAFVYVRDSFAGVLRETDEGYVFQYDAAYLSVPQNPAVSLTLPKREEPYRSKTLFAFFDGLIPEGWLLDLVSHNWKINPSDRFGLLLVASKNCIGAGRIREEWHWTAVFAVGSRFLRMRQKENEQKDGIQPVYASFSA